MSPVFLWYEVTMPLIDKSARLSYQRQYQRAWWKNRRATWLVANGPCCRCGSIENLEVDHIDSLQKVSHNLWSWSEERRNAELVKCQVLCHGCHVEKTIEQMPRTDHGRGQMYHNGCRCDLCRIWKRDSDLKYRSGRRIRQGVESASKTVRIPEGV